MMFSKFITFSIRRGCLLQNLRNSSSRKMSSFGDKGINIDDPDEIEKTLDNAEYNKMFQQSYLNHQQKIITPQHDTADINDISEIEKGNPGCARALVLSLAKIQDIF